MSESAVQQKAEKYTTALFAAETSHTIGATKSDEVLHEFEEKLQQQGLLASGLIPGVFVIRNVANGTPVLLHGYLEPAFASLEFARECVRVLQRSGRAGMGIFKLEEIA